jgi:hypothetical protein
MEIYPKQRVNFVDTPVMSAGSFLSAEIFTLGRIFQTGLLISLAVRLPFPAERRCDLPMEGGC